MTFSRPIDEIYHAVFIQNPAKAYHYRAFTSQFTNMAWVMISVWIITAPPILFIAARLVHSNSRLLQTNVLIILRKCHRYGGRDQNINEFTLSKVYTMVIGAFTRRGYNRAPVTWKARIAFTR